MGPTDGIYRIYHGLTNLALTLSRPTSDKSLQYVLGYYDDQDPAANAYQQWVVKYWSQTKTYTLVNVGGGLYFSYTMDPNGWHYSRGSKKPFHITLQPESGDDTFSFNLKPTRYYMKFEGTAPGTKTVLLGSEYLPAGPLRNWIFRRATQTATPRPQPPLVTVPALRSDTYRIYNVLGRNYLTQKTTADAGNTYPLVNGQRYTSEDPYQEWVVTLHEPSQFYFLRNKASGRWLSTLDGSGRDNNPNDFATVPDTPVLWDIRQTEIEQAFCIQLLGVGVACVMALEASTNRVRLTTKGNNYKTAGDSWRFEPVQAKISATTYSPVPFTGAVKTGLFFIRNRSTWTLLTQEQVNSTDTSAVVVDPRAGVSAFQADNAFQQWTISFYTGLKQYTIQNKGSGRYLSHGYASYDLWTIGSNLEKTWDIVQGEEDEEFLIRLPVNQQVASIVGDKVNTAARSPQLTGLVQRWIFEPVDPTGKDLKLPDDDGNNTPDDTNWTEAEAKQYISNLLPGNIADGSVASPIKNFLTNTAITYKVQPVNPIMPVTGESIATGDAQQIWEFKESGDFPGEFYIFNSATETTITYTETPKDGEFLTTSDDPVSRFQIKSDGESSLLFVVPNTGLAIYLDSATSGSGVYLRLARNVDGFKWRPSF